MSKKFLFLSIIFHSCFLLNKNQSSEKNENERMGIVKKGDLEKKVSIAGSVMPKSSAKIFPSYDGYIKKIYVKVGDHVKVNDPLVAIVESINLNTSEVFPVRSPIAGTVVQVMMSEGEPVKGNRTDQDNLILRVDDISGFYLEAMVPELDVRQLNIGQEATIRVSSVLEKNYHGKISRLSLASKTAENWRDMNKVEFPMRIEITDHDASIRSGMSGVADIIANAKKDILFLGHEFIEKDAKGETWVTKKNKERIAIKLGIQNEENVEIASGLNEGDEVKQVDFLTLSEKK